jgi:Sulfotransferase family
MTTFFIGGCMRTGTSLLNSILCSDQTTNPVIGEVQYVTQMMHHYHWGQRHFHLYLKDTFEDRDAFKAFTADWLKDYLQRTQRRWQSCRHLVLKNPELAHYFPDLSQLVEGSKFFLTVRDPRDTIVSMRAVARKQSEKGISSTLTRMEDDPRKLSHHYTGYYRRFLQGDLHVLQTDLFLVRYEDLVTQTAQVVDQIRAFTGLSLSDYDSASEWQRSAEDYDQQRADPDRAPWTTELHGRGVSDSRIGRYRDMLSNEEIAVIEEACQVVMRPFRYEPLAVHHPPA